MTDDQFNEFMQLARDYIRYEPDTGLFRWIKKPAKRISIGSIAGGATGGYVQLRICGRGCRAHNVAFAIIHGRRPVGEVDHENRIRSDNRKDNLREANQSQNKHNCPVRSHNKLGVKGVSTHPRGGFIARIGYQGKSIHIGYYRTVDEASKAYGEAAINYYGNRASPI